MVVENGDVVYLLGRRNCGGKVVLFWITFWMIHGTRGYRETKITPFERFIICYGYFACCDRI